MGKSFAKVHLCTAGRLGVSGNKILQWVQANGGKYSREVTSNLTHLITTKDAYMNNITAVKEARRLGTVKIVSYEWLEDSLLSRNRTPKLENAYLIENILKEERRAAKEKARSTPKQQGKSTKKPAGKPIGRANVKGSLGADRERKTGSITLGHHVYTDMTTALIYKAMLVRQTITKRNEKFQLTILAPSGSSLDTARAAFERFFEDYTGTSWMLRENRTLPQPKRDDEGNLLPPHEGWYIYKATANIFLDFIQKGSASRTDACAK
ncbi:hypothetical protein BDV26DRAFT_290284 [Aspergillus bertholletiae]|uniref:BRCT domain-containing protein n=1 Tax=Aspergillus bertholletiae TaxID=1226010 RepID=A0A5N7BFH3_9EURO|nr:hypothetical protein BDV26DRAFT_290284 [Aspergillus bertholletiae]